MTEFEKIVKSVAELYWTDGISERTIKEKAQQLLVAAKQEKQTFTMFRTSGNEITYPGAVKNENCRQYTIEIGGLEDLKKIEEFFEENLIISMRYKTIEIYDDYRE